MAIKTIKIQEKFSGPSRPPEPWEGKWEVGEVLGSGGQGTTLMATELSGAKRVGVLKHLNDPGSLKARARMIREVANLTSLHEMKANVPTVYDSNVIDLSPDVSPYFVMDTYLARCFAATSRKTTQ